MIAFELLGGVAQPAVDGNQNSGRPRHPGNELLDLALADRALGGGFGEHVGQVGDQSARPNPTKKYCAGRSKALGEHQQHRHGDGPLVILQLIDVAGGQVQGLGERRLG